MRVLAREQSLDRVEAGATGVVGDVFDTASVADALRAGDTVVHLIGTPHPSPAKAAEFERVDLASIRSVCAAAQRTGVGHFIYVSVAQPAPVMVAYQRVRAEGERMIAAAPMTATFLRPWYVVGPGHRWAMALAPVYAIASLVPSLRDGAQRLGLVTLPQMIAALVNAVESPPDTRTQRIVDVPAIRAARLA